MFFFTHINVNNYNHRSHFSKFSIPQISKSNSEQKTTETNYENIAYKNIQHFFYWSFQFSIDKQMGNALQSLDDDKCNCLHIGGDEVRRDI